MNPATLLFLSSISIIFATYISTIILPNLESKIVETYLNIDQNISETRNTISMISFYELKDIRYQMDELQRNISLQINPSPNFIPIIEKRMIENMINTTRGFAILLTGDKNLRAINEYEAKINSIKNNDTLKFEEKIKEIDIIKNKEVKRINDKQKELEEINKDNQKSLTKLKKYLITYRNIFSILQIVGLVGICISQLLTYKAKI